ncbi:MAG: hypothetical protein OQK82_02590 [Candidatus Pacearchaeota archaeon]|nr:hypothetical protein [Candidatus Pacearchaeota archaeon]
MKMWYRSRGVLTSALGIVVAVVTAISIGVNWASAALAGFSATNVLIRVVTTEKIAWSRKQLEEYKSNEPDNSEDS